MLTNLNLELAPSTSLEDRVHKRKLRTEQPAINLPSYSPTFLQFLYFPLRRSLDFLAALALLILFGPVIILCAGVVKLTSRGPAFYTQQRTGRGGRAFTIYKIRSMVDNCESLTGPRWTIPGDPRITPFGWFLRRSHFDELPQLLNVLKGDMSLIGPRPERPEFCVELTEKLPAYPGRHDVLPGITGLAQVQLPPDTEIENVRRKLRYDLYYVQQCSPWLDLRIAIATALHLLGMPFETVQKLRLVPGPHIVETSPKTEVSMIVADVAIASPRLPKATAA